MGRRLFRGFMATGICGVSFCVIRVHNVLVPTKFFGDSILIPEFREHHGGEDYCHQYVAFVVTGKVMNTLQGSQFFSTYWDEYLGEISW